jgi:branched-chain amino acid transport system permease protein
MGQLILGQLLNGAIVGTLYGIVALGVSLTFGITGIVNFALGAFMMLGAYMTWYFTDGVGIPYPLAVPCAVAVTAAAGLVADQGLFRFTRNNLVNGLLVSIGLIAIMEGGALLIWTSTPKDMEYVLPGVIRMFGIVVPKLKLLVFGLLILVILATYAALTRTWVGRAAFAYAQNREAAVAGLGGGLYASLYSLEPTMGSAYILKAVEAAILAGIGSVLGSLFGGVLLGVTEGLGSIWLPIAFRDAYGLFFLILILLFKPAGLFASRK